MAGAGDGAIVDLRVYGKARGLGEGERYPLICHLLDAGAAARVLWERYVPAGVKRFIADGFGVDVDHAGQLVVLWAALHDVGKAGPDFQADLGPVPAGYPVGRGPRGRHDLAGHRWLESALPGIGYEAGEDDLPGFLVPQLLGGHHGLFHQGLGACGVTLAGAGLGDDAWERQRQAILAAARRTAGNPGPPSEASPLAAVLACAVVILADWLVSQVSHLRAGMGRLPEDGSPGALQDFYAGSVIAAEGLVARAGLVQACLRDGKRFGDVFPRIECPNGLQRSVSDMLPGLVRGPGLLLVTAPPGAGKTETALFAAKVMGKATGRSGVFLALPTTATADELYERACRYLEDQAEPGAALMLLHGMAWLNTRYRPDTSADPVISDGHDDGCGSGGGFVPADWLLRRHRGLCGAWGVGTVDQALMAVLRGRFNVLRMFGLAGKTVVVDEVHACDPYMQGLLRQLLRWLGAFGVPVVLLSATLTRAAAAALVDAYLDGAGADRAAGPVPAVPYPGWLYADARGTVTPVPVFLDRRATLAVTLREITLGPSGAAVRGRGPVPVREAALRAELAPVASSGGCALVVCTTVDEAQDTFLRLQNWFGEITAAGGAAPELELLHARFPVWQRRDITGRITGQYGNPGTGEGVRPAASVLVATAIVEQSLDLDFDLVVSDLAPVALLLQRAGRCHRHPGTRRPAWARSPRLAVLVPPGGPGSPEWPGSWTAVYDESLLTATRRLLEDRPFIEVPGDVQALVDAVYTSPELAEGIEAAVAGRLDDEADRERLANLAAVDGPRTIGSLADLTDGDADPELLATRFGGDSVRALPVFPRPDGTLYFDPALEIPVPAWDTIPDANDCAAIIDRTVPVRGGRWLAGYDRQGILPQAWLRNVHLHDLVLLVHGRAPDGMFTSAVTGGRGFFLDHNLGLRVADAARSPVNGGTLGHV